jgi:glycine/D-amino acid oxidase-like deaminating enzyme/nitrite reductase/ring-hydroxylating ferredoxin subunit
MDNISRWIDDIKPEQIYPALEQDIETEIVVIGAGIAGITTAYLLAKAGKKVVLIDANNIASGETAFTTAFLTQSIDTSLQKLVERFGEQNAAVVWKNGETAMDKIEIISIEEGIDCGFKRCSAYIFASDEMGKKELENEVKIANKLGFKAEFIAENDLKFENFGYMKLDNQGKFHPRKYLIELTRVAKTLGAQVFENTKASEIKKDGDKYLVKVSKYEILARKVIVTTYNPINASLHVLGNIKSEQSYVLEVKIQKDSFAEAIYWNTESPYHYFRIDKYEDYDTMIFGGEDHETGKDPDSKRHYDNLEEYLKTKLNITDYEILHTWSGQILSSGDGLPLIGETKDNLLVATGFAGNGMTFGTFSAMLFCDIILGNDNEYIDLYKPKRLNKHMNFFQQGVNYMKEIVEGRILKKADTNSIDSVVPDSGAVVEMDGKRFAIYKDAAGNITKLSPICTHLGCVVDWNNAEKTWDCPCHGSRYQKDGTVLNGPATKPLAQA